MASRARQMAAASRQTAAQKTQNPLSSISDAENSNKETHDIPIEKRCISIATYLYDLLLQFTRKRNVIFKAENFQPLFAPEGELFGEWRVTTRACKLILEELFKYEDFHDDNFSDFLQEILDSSLSEETTHLCTALLRVLQTCSRNSAKKSNLQSRKFFEDESFDHTAKQLAKVNIQVQLPYYDGARGRASRFINDFSEAMVAHGYEPSQWSILLRSCLLKETSIRFLLNTER